MVISEAGIPSKAIALIRVKSGNSRRSDSSGDVDPKDICGQQQQQHRVHAINTYIGAMDNGSFSELQGEGSIHGAAEIFIMREMTKVLISEWKAVKSSDVKTPSYYLRGRAACSRSISGLETPSYLIAPNEKEIRHEAEKRDNS